MTTSPTLQLNPDFGPMLFADCPFCLQPVPLDAATAPWSAGTARSCSNSPGDPSRGSRPPPDPGVKLAAIFELRPGGLTLGRRSGC